MNIDVKQVWSWVVRLGSNIDVKHVWSWVMRHSTNIALAALFVLFGGLNPEHINTLKAASLAVIVAAMLSNVVLFTYSKDNFEGKADAITSVYRTTGIIVGLVYLAYYLVEFI